MLVVAKVRMSGMKMGEQLADYLEESWELWLGSQSGKQLAG